MCAISARAGVPIQPSTHAQSSAGKNALWDMVLSLFPEEKIVRRSGMSAKALFRTSSDLRGAVLYIQEVAGSENADFSIRVLQSDGRLEYEATETMPNGSMQTVVHTTEGPTVVVQTTTKNHLHPENETRVLPIYIDESEEQTARITRSIKRRAAGRGPDDEASTQIRERWQDAIRLLEPVEVVIPYAERINIPKTPLRVRRDANRLMDVIRVVAWLYQHQRGRDAGGRVVAEEEDFHTAMRLVSSSLTQAWQALTPSEAMMLAAIRKLNPHLRDKGFKRRDLKVKGISDPQQKRALTSLATHGYLDCDYRQGPQGYSYTLARDVDEVALGISLEDEKRLIESYRIIGDDPIENAHLQEKRAIGSSDHEKTEVEGEHRSRERTTPLGSYEHN